MLFSQFKFFFSSLRSIEKSLYLVDRQKDTDAHAHAKKKTLSKRKRQAAFMLFAEITLHTHLFFKVAVKCRKLLLLHCFPL